MHPIKIDSPWLTDMLQMHGYLTHGRIEAVKLTPLESHATQATITTTAVGFNKPGMTLAAPFLCLTKSAEQAMLNQARTST